MNVLASGGCLREVAKADALHAAADHIPTSGEHDARITRQKGGRIEGRKARSKAEGRRQKEKEAGRQKVPPLRPLPRATSAMFAEPTLKTFDFLRGTTSASSCTTMNQWREDMKKRTHAFAVDVVRFVQEIPDRPDTRRLKDQLVGAASGADLNWHAACRGRTHKEFTAKVGVVLEEADEAAECLDRHSR